MNIPVLHDDQHGTAIISAAGLINACFLTGRKMDDVKVVVNGAGAAAIACTALIKALGVRHENILMCDRKGVIWRGREGDPPVQVGPCGRYRPAHAGRSAGGRGHLPRPVGQGRAEARDAREDGGPADHLRDGQSRSRDHPARSQGGAARLHHRHRPLGLSQPGQQRPRLPVHLPRRARRAGDRDQRSHEDRRRPRHRRTGARAGARGSRRGLWRAVDAVRARLHHPRAVRSAADGSGPVRRRQGGDGYRAWRRSRSRISTPIATASSRGSTRPPRC